ncbi:DUF1707 SHOCT-like domain-containing protein [Nocardioides sp. URHA0020]|uniref:DUF1707 SHOCT-like domain-containing protein n=1 Tax=Nocardioides sp. URHA0020 TaxID=1380392 RepID=UPI00048DAB75|nr:DUF1707 domain-containing protein [Nocardioides sp. URHA0020]
MDSEFWSSFTHDPREAQFGTIRASDQDRDVVQQALTEAYADGRLDRKEFDERSERTTDSRTLGELVPILGDLVSTTTVVRTSRGLAQASSAELHERAVEAYVSDRREAVFGFLFATLICTVVWYLFTNEARFWPIFVALGTGINVAKTISRKREIVASHERKLEKKRAKELGQPWTPNDRASE